MMAAGTGNWDEFVRTGGGDVGARLPMALGWKLFEPITIFRHVTLRNCEERWPTPDLADLGRGRWYELPDGHACSGAGVMITPSRAPPR